MFLVGKGCIENKWVNGKLHFLCTVSKKMILKISQILPENTCARVSFLIKLQVEVATYNTFVVPCFQKFISRERDWN